MSDSEDDFGMDGFSQEFMNDLEKAEEAFPCSFGALPSSSVASILRSQDRVRDWHPAGYTIDVRFRLVVASIQHLVVRRTNSSGRRDIKRKRGQSTMSSNSDSDSDGAAKSAKRKRRERECSGYTLRTDGGRRFDLKVAQSGGFKPSFTIGGFGSQKFRYLSRASECAELPGEAKKQDRPRSHPAGRKHAANAVASVTEFRAAIHPFATAIVFSGFILDFEGWRDDGVLEEMAAETAGARVSQKYPGFEGKGPWLYKGNPAKTIGKLEALDELCKNSEPSQTDSDRDWRITYSQCLWRLGGMKPNCYKKRATRGLVLDTPIFSVTGGQLVADFLYEDLKMIPDRILPCELDL
ncbi:hypothetical protein C8J57DRAFT_1229769 [Mycena rebaudengoi]|nr:hypothetical protein C8J57DRAFT_1229769 [Mycena rebaudengoi]